MLDIDESRDTWELEAWDDDYQDWKFVIDGVPYDYGTQLNAPTTFTILVNMGEENTAIPATDMEYAIEGDVFFPLDLENPLPDLKRLLKLSILL